MNTSSKTTKISSVFLATVLIAGMIASSPSFITNALAFEMGDNYGNDNYGNDNYRGDDYRNHDAKDVSVYKKIDCSNKNINVNGFEFNALPDTLTGLATAQAQTGDDARNGFNNGERNIGGHGDKDPLCFNINRNNNEGAGNVNPGAEEDTCGDEVETCFRDFLTDQAAEDRLIAALGSPAGLTIQVAPNIPVTFHSFADICLFLQGLGLEGNTALIQHFLSLILLQIQVSTFPLPTLTPCVDAAISIEI